LTAIFDYAKIAEALLEANAKVNAADKGGNTTLHLAAEYGSVDTVKALLKVKGIDVDKMNSDGETPSHLAAKFGHMSIVRALLDKGADINVVNKDGNTPLDLTDNGKIKALLQSIKDANDDTDISLSSRSGYISAKSTTQTEEQTSTFFDSFFSMLTEPILLVVLFFGGLISWLFWSSTEKTAGHVEQSYDPFVGLNDSDYNDQNDLHLFQ
ncbi:MAG: ankyrin repeat domain-containing protein, partial [Wolbachia sp.]